jgi:hypothetical protein
MDTSTIPPKASIGIDIGKDVFHIVGFSNDGRIASRRNRRQTSFGRARTIENASASEHGSEGIPTAGW